MRELRRFQNRSHAGAELADRFSDHRDAKNTIVIGLARGGIPVAATLSEKLNLPCSVFVSRKIGTPEDRRCALGAVTETGLVFLDQTVLSAEPWLPRELRRYIEEEIQLREADVERRCAFYRRSGTRPDFTNKTAIVVDDGTFTGATFMAAIQSLRALGATFIAGGLPVAPLHAIQHIRPMTDKLVVLDTPEKIKDLNDYYDDLPELSDEETASCLAIRQKATDVIPVQAMSA